MKRLLICVLLFFLASSTQIDCSLHPLVKVDKSLWEQAMELDSQIMYDYESHNAVKTAVKMDQQAIPLYSAEDVLDCYYTNPNAVKEAFLKMKRSKRIALLNETVDLLSDLYGVNHYTIKAIMKQESHYNPTARSHKGAVGLMQLMPSTAKMMGVSDIENPIDNLIGGIKYVKHLSDKFSWKTHLVLAAYNAGPGAVERHRGVPPYPETEEYIQKVLEYRKEYRGAI